jgi:hypothetical protein
MPLGRSFLLSFIKQSKFHEVIHLLEWPAVNRMGAVILLMLFCAFSVQGQNAVMQAHVDRNSAALNMTQAELCTFDLKGLSTQAKDFSSVLQSEELKVFELPTRSFIIGVGNEKPLLAKYKLSAKPQWILIDKKRGTLLAQGDQVPNAASFAKVLRDAGFRDWVKELRAYLREFPDAQEARELLIQLVRQRAERTALRYLGLQIQSRRERNNQASLSDLLQGDLQIQKLDLSQAKPLNEVQDLEAWGDFAQELGTVFRSGQWREMHFAWLREGRPLDSASPTLQVLYLRWQPAVEAALRREPSSEAFWDLWLWMNRAQGGKAIRPLLASLAPTPIHAPGQWPPDRVAQSLLTTAQSLEDWRALKDFYQAQWNNEPHVLKEEQSSGGERPDQEVHVALLEKDWKRTLGPLLESCIQSGDSAGADAYFMEALNGSRWIVLVNKAVSLAKRCGKPAVAQRWASLKPSRPRG